MSASLYTTRDKITKNDARQLIIHRPLFKRNILIFLQNRIFRIFCLFAIANMAEYGWGGGGGWGEQVMEDEDIIDPIEQEEPEDQIEQESTASEEEFTESDETHESVDQDEAFHSWGNSHSGLETSMMKFIRYTRARDLVLEESPILRLVKALHGSKLEDVILAVEEGAQFQVCLIILFISL